MPSAAGVASPAPPTKSPIPLGASPTPVSSPSTSPSPGTTAKPTPTAAPTATPTASPTVVPTATATATPGSPGPAGAIKHVVIIVQENRSFDNLFNGFPGADTATSGVTSTGATVPLKAVGLDAGIDVDHGHQTWYQQYAGGRLFFDLRAFGQPPTLAPYGYVPQSQTAQYTALAAQYTLADRMFQSNGGPSFPAHQYLTAGSSAIGNGQYVADNPTQLDGAWGCDQPSTVTVPLLGPNGTELPGPFPCFDYPTIADRLDAKGHTWSYYAPALFSPGGIWSAFDAVRHIRYGPDWANVLSPETRVLTDAQGTLRDVTWVVPSYLNSDHSGNGSASGPAWVTSVVNAIGGSPNWNSTAIFIVWDDWGGWFDHVVPPQLDAMGLGFRVPLIVVSPYAKRGYVSHVQHEFGSLLHFTEETFGLDTLGQTDLRADDLSDCFDFTHGPQPFRRFASTYPVRAFLDAVPDGRAPDND